MGLRVLIVEDNIITREMLKGMLAILGHEVVGEVDNLQDLLAAYKEQKPDVVTMDLSLPKEDGLTILRALRKSDAAARVVVISGNSQERIIDEIHKAGAAGLLAKPIQFEALEKCLASI
ncbi:MAG TPA: two-component system response regulator [Elusimicrobia bacterium]|nr:two-component system response regulator [Elusimicrobiota bacterium]